MLRVLFVTHSFPPADRPLASIGGMQRVATELHAALTEHPRVALSTRALRSSWRWIGPNTVRFLGGVLAGLPRQARREHADVVLFSSMVTAALAPALRKRLPETVLAAVTHGQDVVLPVAPYQRWLPTVFRALDVVLPVSRATGEACVARGMVPERVAVQPNGIQLDRFPDRMIAQNSRWMLERTGAPADTFFLLSVGRQVKRKGSAWCVEHVLPLLPDRVHHVIVGTGPEDEAIRETAERAGLSARVHQLGRVSEEDLSRALRSAHLFIMPNVPIAGDMEGFGVVMLEAGLCGLPAVAANLEGVADVIVEGENGHLVAPLDPAAFARAIEPYLDNPAQLNALSERAAALVRSRFAWPAVADQLVHTLEQVTRRDA